MIDRRAMIAAALATPALAWGAGQDGLDAVEAGLGGRLGVFAVNVRTGASLSWRADERFLMCSTFKALAVGMVLSRVDQGREHLDRLVRFGPLKLPNNSPATAGKAALRLEALCRAAIELSDNGAAMLIQRELGGPAAITAWLRAGGDKVTRLDRGEPALNRLSGDLDTTTPRAMAASLERLLLGGGLKPASRALLTDWMVHCKTGLDRLRAGVPLGWRVADKTGTGYDGAAGDNAVIWRDQATPIVVSAYTLETKAAMVSIEAAFAEVGRIVVKRLAA